LACFSSGFSFQVQTIEPKFFKDCNFFVKENILTRNRFGRCTLFVYDEQDDFLVDGINKINLQKYFYCSTARSSEHMCGVMGKKFQPKNGKV